MRRFATGLALLFPTILGAQSQLGVSVFNDRNGNGRQDPAERPVPNVVVSNQRDVVATDSNGSARIDRGTTGMIFVSVPNGYRSVGAFWRSVSPTDSQLTFALQPVPVQSSFSFVHASDTHIAPNVVERTRRLPQLVDSLRPAFTIVTGDLIRDAASQQEPLARSYFELFNTETRNWSTPLWTVPGNHDLFGILTSRSRIPTTHPLFDRSMYRSYLGPDYYSFTHGGVHFVGLNTLMTDDSSYYGRVDSVQLAWLRRDLAHIPANMPVVTFNHIPMVSGWEILTGFVDIPVVASIKQVDGKPTHRHTVANVEQVIGAMRGHPWVLALGGHIHVSEKLVFELDGMPTRFEQAGAVVGGQPGDEFSVPSGITYYTVRNGKIDAGRFVRLDTLAKGPSR